MNKIMFKPHRILDFFIFVREYANWPEILAMKLRPNPEKYIVACLKKYNLRFKTYSREGNIITLFNEIFIRDVYRLKGFNLREGATVIDIGATIGMFELFVTSLVKGARIIACEPVKGNFALLKENLALNGIENCVCHEAAVGAKRGKVRFIRNESMTMGSIDFSGRDARAVMVDCLPLQDIFEMDKIAHCDLLKLDCQGAEYEILFNLPDAIFEKIDNITMETHDMSEERMREKMESFLAEKRYKVTSLGNDILGTYIVAKRP
jgi:FkbM family methyltransferase